LFLSEALQQPSQQPATLKSATKTAL
jgi:hypothetical protein